jgi:hypothetical protein
MRAERGMTRHATDRARRWGAVFATAALLLQLFVTAGHFHPEDFGALGGGRVTSAIAGSGAGGPGSPGGQPGAPAHDECALCFSLQLAGSTALPDIAPPPTPSEQLAEALAAPQELRLAAAPYLLFRTRAPPSL